MAVLRVLAWIFLLIATIALVSDITRANTTGVANFTALAAHWKTLSPQSIAATMGFVQKSLHPLLWDPVLMRLLILPTWFLFGALGLTCAILGRKKRRVNIYAN